MNSFSRLIGLVICSCSQALLPQARAQGTPPRLSPPTEAPAQSRGFECFLQSTDSAMPKALTAKLLKIAPDYCAALQLVEEIEGIPYLTTKEEVNVVIEESEAMFNDRRIPASILCSDAASRAYSSWNGLHDHLSESIEERLRIAHLHGMKFGPSLDACKSALRVLPQRTPVSKRIRIFSQ